MIRHPVSMNIVIPWCKLVPADWKGVSGVLFEAMDAAAARNGFHRSRSVSRSRQSRGREAVRAEPALRLSAGRTGRDDVRDYGSRPVAGWGLRAVVPVGRGSGAGALRRRRTGRTVRIRQQEA